MYQEKIHQCFPLPKFHAIRYLLRVLMLRYVVNQFNYLIRIYTRQMYRVAVEDMTTIDSIDFMPSNFNQ